MTNPEMLLYFRDSSKSLIAQIDTYRQFDAILRFNDVSTWSMILSASLLGKQSEVEKLLALEDEIEWGTGIVLKKAGNSSAVMSGDIGEIDYEIVDNEEFYVLYGEDDTEKLKTHIALPVTDYSLIGWLDLLSQHTSTGSSTGHSNETVRTIICDELLDNVGHKHIRITIKSGVSQGFTIDEMYIGHQDPDGEEYAFLNPIQVTFNGGDPDVTIAANTSIVSDSIEFTSKAKVLITSAYIATGPSASCALTAGIPNCKHYDKAGNDASTELATGYAQHGVDGDLALVIRIETTQDGVIDITGQEFDERAGKAETVMKEYVDYNLGPNAHVDRADVVTIENDLASGTDVIEKARFEILLDLLQKIGIDGGGLGFKVVQDDTDLEFQVYTPTDKTSEIVFGKDLGNLPKAKFVYKRPKANYIFAGGDGDGIDRVLFGKGDSASISTHGRVEKFVDDGRSDGGVELEITANERLDVDGEMTNLELTPIDLPNMTYGEDYELGDKVKVKIRGVAIEEIIREIRIKITANETIIKPYIGSSKITTNSPLANTFTRLKNVEKTIRYLGTR